LAELNGVENTASIKEGMALFIPRIAPEGEKNRAEENQNYEDKKITPANTGAKQSDTGKDKIERGTTGKSGATVIASGSSATKKKQANQEKEPLERIKKDQDKGGETAKGKGIVKKGAIQEESPLALKKDSEQSEKKVTEPPEARKEESHQKGKFMWPAKGKVISTYGPQPNGMFYNGIRIEIKKETAVLAASTGHVIFSAFLKDYGETVIIKHSNDYATVYTHLTRRLVKVDQLVKRGESIAMIAPSPGGASFLDFEIRYRNKAKDPLLFL